jgi:hypothetical protein
MRLLLLTAALLPISAFAKSDREPIIDMHLHARAANYAGENPPPMCTPFEIMPRSDNSKGVYEGMTFDRPPCTNPVHPATTNEQVMPDTIAAMERLNIYGMVSGEPEMVGLWAEAAPTRIMKASDYRLPGTRGSDHVGVRSIDELRALHAQGGLRVIGEIMAQYEGVSPDDPRLEPIWALAEELDVPVAIHLGPGEPGQPYADGGYRAALGDPLLLEPVLARHPRLRVSVMHAGYPMAERLRALLFSVKA